MRNLIRLAVAVMAMAAVTSPSVADTLEDVKAAGKIVVGVKQDYRPWGYLDEKGNIIGLEIDLAKDVAERLGVELELVPVVASNRMEFLQQGRIDLIIATLGDNENRRQVIGMVEPNYYAGGVNVLARADSGLKTWADLKGKDVCAIQGAYYNRQVAQDYGANLVAFAGVPEATAALSNGNCVGFVYDNTWIESQLASNDQWAGYEMPLQTEQEQPWAIAVPLEEREGPFGKLMSEIVTDWHASGKLIELNAAHGIADSPFLQEMHEKFSS